MKITTKYNRNDIAWTMINNKPIEVTIRDIDITVSDTIDIRYEINLNHPYIKEENLYRTKDELIKSL